MPLPLPSILNALVRMAAGVVLVLWWLPTLALPAFDELPRMDRVILSGAAGALALVVAGYALTAVHLYSWLTLAGALVAGTYLLRNTRPHRRIGATVAPDTLSELDRLHTLPRRVIHALGRAGATLVPRRFPNAFGLAAGLAGVAILGVGTWLRWFMPLWHAAPLYSDFVVVLAWVKQLDGQQIFPGGVYLKGYHLVLAGLQTLTLAQPITFVKFAGPAVGLGMLLSVAFFTYRLTGRPVPALVASLVYGTLPSLLPYVAPRQSASDSQEFGNMLVLPAAWFIYRAWTKPQSTGYRLGAALLLCLIATVHPIAILNGALVAAAATAAAAAASGLRRATFRSLAGMLGVGAVIAVVPPALGLAAGLGFYGNAVQFGIGTSLLAAPPLLPATVAAAGAAVLALIALPLLRRQREALGPPLLLLLTLLLSVAVRQLPRFGIHLTSLETRSGEMVALAVAPALGIGWACLEEALGRLVGGRPASWTSLAALAAVATMAWIKLPPVPFNAYRMDPDAFVAAYVQIERTVPHTEWLAVSSRDGYDYALGQGFFLNPQPFLQHVAPRGPWPSYRYTNGRTAVLGENYIFIFVAQRAWPTGQPTLAAAVRAATAANTGLRAWVTAWQAQGGHVQIFYNGPYLRVYELQRAPSPQGTPQTTTGGG